MIYVGLAFVVAALAWGIPQVRKAFNPGESLPGLTGESRPTSEGGAGGNRSPLIQEARQVEVTTGGEPWRKGWRVAGVIRDAAGQGKAVIYNGKYHVFVDLQRYCVMDLDRGPVCQWEGAEITMYSDQRYATPSNPSQPPEAAPAVGPPVLSAAAQTAP